MPNIKIEFNKNLDLLQEKAAVFLEQKIASFIENKVLFLVSGGSSISVLNKLNSSNLNSNITISVIDERFSLSEDENSFSQIERTDFYKTAVDCGCQFISTKISGNESKEELALRFNDSLNNWIVNNPEGKIIATLGVGSDGHTSGIMPYPEDPNKFKTLFDDGISNHLIVSYDALNKNQFPLRVTSTMNLIRKLDAVAVYVVSENKKGAIQNIFSENGSLASNPSRIIREIQGEVMLFTDQDVTI